MPRLPVLSSRELTSALERLGFAQVGQRGSHLKLRRGTATVIVPMHREVRRGTLAAILDQAGLTIEQLMRAVNH